MSSDVSAAPVIFECLQCGDCCQGYGGTYVTEADIRRIADFLNLSAETVKNRFCSLSGSRYLLVQGDHEYCVFWHKNCSIHPVKPKMCRAWPYIPGVLKDFANWRAMAGSCPGIRADAPQAIVESMVRQKIAENAQHYPGNAE